MSEYHTDKPENETWNVPIPDLSELREKKKGYRSIPIDTQDERYREPLVALSDFGVAGQAYYSRPNAMFDSPLPGVSPEVYVRESVGRTLASINDRLKQAFVTDLFGGEVELFVQDGVRSLATQRYLHSIAFPEKIKTLHPDWDGDQIEAERDKFIAFPTVDEQSPSPHAASAVDVWLRYIQPTRAYVSEDDFIPMGYGDAEISERSYPDYYERVTPTTPDERLYQRNRRLFYAIMTGKLFGEPTDMTPNPTEWWHYDLGNQLWSVTTGKRPYYGLPPEDV